MLKELEEKNPLSYLLGMYMRIERNNKGETVKSASRKLVLGNSYYRMIESGNANLHPSKMFLFYSFFGDSFKMSLEKLSKYLCAIQVIENENVKIGSPKHKLLGLSKYNDSDFITLEQEFSHLFNEDSNKHEITAHSIVQKFLNENTETLTTEVQTHFLNQKLNKLPSVYFDVVSNCIDELMYLPVILGNKSVWQWERRNRSFLREQICITNSPSSICSKENLSQYKYWHLWSDSFEKVKMIIFTDNPNETESWVTKEFKKNLKLSLKAENDLYRLEHFNSAVSKLDIKVLSKLRNQEILNDLLEHRVQKPSYEPFEFSDFTFDAAWIWTMRKSDKSPLYHVGYLADIIYEDSAKNKNLAETMISLDFERVQEIYIKLNSLWKNQ